MSRRAGISAFSWALVTIVLLGVSPLASAALVTGSENVSLARHTDAYTIPPSPTVYGPFDWTAKYVRSFDGTKFEKDVQVNFQFDPALGWNAAQKAAFITSAQNSVSGLWNNRMAITDLSSGAIFPIEFKLTIDGPFDQTVTVRAGAGATDMTNWYAADVFDAVEKNSVMAHEFGHMVGLFDEYLKGAIDSISSPTLTDTGMMGFGARSLYPEFFPRYFEQFLDFARQLNPGDEYAWALVKNPEPSTIILYVIGFSGLAIMARKRRKAA